MTLGKLIMDDSLYRVLAHSFVVSSDESCKALIVIEFLHSESELGLRCLVPDAPFWLSTSSKCF